MLLDRISQLVEVGIERTKEPRQGVPAKAARSALDTRDECGVGAKHVAELSLGQSGALPERSESSAERDLVVLRG